MALIISGSNTLWQTGWRVARLAHPNGSRSKRHRHLGLGWLVALRFMDWGRNSAPFFITLAGLCLLLPVSEDQTRVLAVITFPLVAVYWLLNKDFLEKLTRKEISLLFTAWTLIPWGWTWVGEPKWSVFPYDVAYIMHRIFGWFSVPADPSFWPFG